MRQLDVGFLIKMRLRQLVYGMYRVARRVARAAGLTRLLRGTLGPVAGRLLFRATSNVDRPLVVQDHRMYLASPGQFPPADMALDRYEPETTGLLQRVIEPGMVVVDVGAHVGYYALLAAKRVGPQGKVYAFEPDPTNYALLLKNIELNGYRNILTTGEAVSDRVGTATLYLAGLDTGRHSLFRHGLPQRGKWWSKRRRWTCS